jgi:hypothetical protein
VSKHKRTKARGWKWREGREREGRGGRLGLPSWLVCKEREEKRREEE